MKRITFTSQNRQKNRDRVKTQTRRLHKIPRYQVGDIIAHCEPTKFIGTEHQSVWVTYPDTNNERIKVPMSVSGWRKLSQRKNQYALVQPLFMLDDFARHFLRITQVKEERVQGITEEDAIAEGIQPVYGTDGVRPLYVLGHPEDIDQPLYRTAVDAFKVLWDSIHCDKKGRNWDANPKVVAYSYEFLFELPGNNEQVYDQAS